MSVKLSVAARRTYDALKERPGARPRASDARDPDVLAEILSRLSQLIGEYRLNVYRSPAGTAFVFWHEIAEKVNEGAFDDLLTGL